MRDQLLIYRGYPFLVTQQLFLYTVFHNVIYVLCRNVSPFWRYNSDSPAHDPCFTQTI